MGRMKAEMALVRAGLALAFVLGLASVARAEEPAEPLLEQGRAVYEAHCQACHEGGVAKAPHASMLQLMLPASIERALTDGVMKDQGAALTVDEKRAVAAYLTGVTGTVAVKRAPFCEKPDWFDESALPDARGWGFDPGNTRFVPKEIGGVEAGDLPRLKLKWAFAYPGAVRARSQPVTAAGALFVGSHDGTVYALDQKTGCIHWTFEASAEVRTSLVIRPWKTEDGKAQRGMLFFGDLVGNVYGIDIRTGELIWREKAHPHPNATITASPALFEDRLYVAVSSLEVATAADPNYECCNFRGRLNAFDAETGRLIWAADTIEEPLRETGRNAYGVPQFGPSGAPIWAGIAVDPGRRRLYVGTGENYSSPASKTSDAILAFDADDGRMLWARQMTENDVWNMGCEVEDRANCPEEEGPDFDFGAAPILARLSDGRDVILAGQKSGDVHALDPDRDGAVLWSRKVGRGGIQGGVHFGMAALGDILFAPISDFDDGHDYGVAAQPGMHALDAHTGEILWSNLTPDTCAGKEFCSPGISAAVTAIPGAVVAGAMDGVLRAYDAATGKVIWSFDSNRSFAALGGAEGRGGSFGGATGPVFKNGMMFVNSGYGIYFHMPGNVLLAFELE